MFRCACASLCVKEGAPRSPRSPRFARLARRPDIWLVFLSCVSVCVRRGAPLASLRSACSVAGNVVRLSVLCLCICNVGVPRWPRFARLARHPVMLAALCLVSLYVQRGDGASLASLRSARSAPVFKRPLSKPFWKGLVFRFIDCCFDSCIRFVDSMHQFDASIRVF